MDKKIIISALLGMILLASFVKADQVNMDISVNGTANLNITVDADDTEARQAIAATQEDVYGTLTGSGPKDIILNEIANSGSGQGIQGEGTQDINIDKICDDPYLMSFIKSMSSLPPQEFVDYVKALGYDDESHITLIWTICQDKYISENEGQWSTDRDFDYNSLVHTIRYAMDWLLGLRNSATEDQKNIGTDLDRYFASDRDVYYLLRRVNDLQLRVEALENTIEEINETAYCQGKLEVLEKYGLPAVKCGETTYRNHIESPITGESMILGITPANEEPTTNGNGLEEPVQEDGYSESVLMSSENGNNEQVDDGKVITMGISQVIDPKEFIMRATVFLSTFTITAILLRIGLPMYQGIMYNFSMKIKSKFGKKDRKVKKISKLFRTFAFIL